MLCDHLKFIRLCDLTGELRAATYQTFMPPDSLGGTPPRYVAFDPDMPTKVSHHTEQHQLFEQ